MGYLEPASIKSGAIHWSRNDERYASIGIVVNTFTDRPYLELNYNCNKAPISYKVYLVSISSNIGKGKVWYFVCPSTGKRCRKLYMIQTYFLHRKAFTGAIYEKQTYSKKARQQIKVLSWYLGIDKIDEEMYSRHFRKQYAGEPTKRYLQLLKKLKQADEVSEKDLTGRLKR